MVVDMALALAAGGDTSGIFWSVKLLAPLPLIAAGPSSPMVELIRRLWVSAMVMKELLLISIL